MPEGTRNVGTLVGAEVRPVDMNDTYPVAYQSEIKGGFHSLPTIADRDAITEARREFGMLCYIAETDITYQLKDVGEGNLSNNAGWEEYKPEQVFEAVESISGNMVDNTDPKNPVINKIEDLPEELEIYCVSNPTGNGLGRRIMYRYNGIEDFLYINEFIGQSGISFGNCFSVMVRGNDIFLGYYDNIPVENSNLPIFGILALYDCKYINNKIVVGSSAKRVYTEIITTNIGGSPRLHSEEISSDGFLYYTTRVYTTTTDTQILKINAYDLNDYKIFSPFKGGAIHNTQLYKNNLYLLRAQVNTSTATMYKVDTDLNSVEEVFITNLSGVKRVKRSTPFLINQDKFYITTIRNENTLASNNTIGLLIYGINGKLISDIDEITIGNNTTSISGSPTVHWLSIFNNNLLLHAAAGSSTSRNIARVNLSTFETFFIPSPATVLTDDNCILSNGYIILNPEGSEATNFQYKLKYNDFNDFQNIGYEGFFCTGSRIIYNAPITSLITDTSKLANKGENGTDKYATESLVATKQNTLVSGSNIKTVNGQSVLGSGDITISGGGGGTGTVTNVSGTAGQINVANPTTTPVISIDPAYQTAQATETTRGTSAIATTSETATGTNDAKYITPLKLKTETDKKFNNPTGASTSIVRVGGDSVTGAALVYFTNIPSGLNIVNQPIAVGQSNMVALGSLQGQINALIPNTGINTQNGVGGSTKQYVIPHGLGVVPKYANAIPQNQASAGIESITWNSSNIIINYTVVPTAGTNNLSWGWIAFR